MRATIPFARHQITMPDMNFTFAQIETTIFSKYLQSSTHGRRGNTFDRIHSFNPDGEKYIRPPPPLAVTQSRIFPTTHSPVACQSSSFAGHNIASPSPESRYQSQALMTF